MVDLFSRTHGRVTAVAKGVRAMGRKPRGAPLHPFVPMAVGLTGRSDLKTLTHSEAQPFRPLTGLAWWSGCYLNELVTRLLRPVEPYPELFDGYSAALSVLVEAGPGETAVALRRFELLLLEQIGYGIEFVCAAPRQPLRADRRYEYVAELGFRPHQGDAKGFSGQALLQIAANDWGRRETEAAGRRLVQTALTPHLQGRALRTPQMYRAAARLMHAASEPETEGCS